MPRSIFLGDIMSVGQQIYFAIELFTPEKRHRDRFSLQLTRILAGCGTAPGAAREIASVVADALSKPRADYHLEMAHLITFHPPLTALLEVEVAAAHALHRYMTYFLDVTSIQAGSEARYAVN